MHHGAQTTQYRALPTVAVAVVSGLLFLLIPFTGAFFTSIFLAWLVFRLDSRIIAGVAIVFLVCIPILLSMGLETRAEEIAVYVYFLLVITVVLQIAEYIRDRKVSPGNMSGKKQLNAVRAKPQKALLSANKKVHRLKPHTTIMDIVPSGQPHKVSMSSEEMLRRPSVHVDGIKPQK